MHVHYVLPKRPFAPGSASRYRPVVVERRETGSATSWLKNLGITRRRLGYTARGEECV